MLDDRKLTILRAIVTDYVSMREPVGSRALVERYDLDVSPATVRNDMAVLEEEGYITQPHTSAGRIPTDKGYRLFVDRLGAVKPLSPAERRAIQSFMDGVSDIDDLVAKTVRALAQITHQVAIVQYPVLTNSVIRHIELVHLGAGRGLLIVVNSSGQVDQHPFDLGTADESLVADLRGRLNVALVGLSPTAACARVDQLLTELPESLAELAATVCPAVKDLQADTHSTRVVIGGVPNLTRFADQYDTAVRPVLEALEEQVVLLKLLGEVAGAGEVNVRIGQENPYEPLRTTSMVASGYGVGPGQHASLGVVGPTRMDYPSTMAAVRAVARYISRYLAEG
ncbi:MAG: heat-inducible transcriptional repressor HrcA [Actinobacteria bacterium HGW-Actinobacteria-2]|nr:MAG: heat-inducible transcriptional repressor HrcA [Actinobacteria bacterium HGW-Actinobacteria-2]